MPSLLVLFSKEGAYQFRQGCVFVLLIAYLIKQSMQTNSVVLDGFLGSRLHLLFRCIVI